MNCFTEQENGERIIGGLGWFGIIFFCLILPIVGVPMLIVAIWWKATSMPARYNREVMARQNEDDYQSYKNKMEQQRED